jgi:hypothetical protein
MIDPLSCFAKRIDQICRIGVCRTAVCLGGAVVLANPRHPDESQDPEPRASCLVILGPDFRQDDGVGWVTLLPLPSSFPRRREPILADAAMDTHSGVYGSPPSRG